MVKSKMSQPEYWQTLDNLIENTLDLALKRRARWMLQNLNLKTGERVLDIGCGDGYYLYLLSNLGLKLKLAGTDFDKKALRSAKKNLGDKKIKLKFGDLMKKLPFKSGSFDKIIISEVLEHLPNDLAGLKEVKRVLKKNGILAISVPNENFPFLWDPVNWLLQNILNTHIKSGFWAGIWNQHERLYSKRNLKHVIKMSGLGLQRIDCQTFWSLPFNHYIINFGARMLAKNNSAEAFAGANKFGSTNKRSLIVQIYRIITKFVDDNNNFSSSTSGVSLVAIAKKT